MLTQLVPSTLPLTFNWLAHAFFTYSFIFARVFPKEFEAKKTNKNLKVNSFLLDKADSDDSDVQFNATSIRLVSLLLINFTVFPRRGWRLYFSNEKFNNLADSHSTNVNPLTVLKFQLLGIPMGYWISIW